MNNKSTLLSSEELLDKLEEIVGENIADEVYDNVDVLEQYNVKWAHSVSWNGYDVYVPSFTGNPPCIGLPLVVLVKDGKARMSTSDEALEYLDYENKENAKAKSTEALKRELIIKTD